MTFLLELPLFSLVILFMFAGWIEFQNHESLAILFAALPVAICTSFYIGIRAWRRFVQLYPDYDLRRFLKKSIVK